MPKLKRQSKSQRVGAILSLMRQSRGSARSAQDGNLEDCSNSLSMGVMPDRKANGKSPTCKVCGDESSGFHYGVNSCEGCKGFFRRCITQGMTHKCSNEEKCEITPFTRNSCQYCRLKKCFAVGMSREASRLGRRPKRLKDSSGESKQPHANLPIAPYPSPAELYKLRMAELQRLLQQNGTFKSDLMQAFLSAAKVSFQEHQRQGNDNQKHKPGGKESQEESGYTSLSPTNSSKSHSPLTELTTTNNQNLNNKLIDNKDEIYGNLDNYQYSQDANIIQTDNQTGNNAPVYTEIKQEPDLDNQTLSMTSDYSSSSSLEASPLIMGEMSPDTLMDNNNMMEGMMGGLMGGMMEGMMSGMMTGQMPEMPSMIFPEPDPNANVIDVDRIMEEVKQVPTDRRRQLMEQVIEGVGNAHMQTVRPTYQTIAEANQRLSQMAAEGNMPDMSKLMINPSAMWQEFIQSMVLEITNVVRFCKKLPGFGEIDQEDQIIMIKKGAFEVLMVRMCMLVDHQKAEMFDPNMKMKCPRAIVRHMPMGFFMEEFFSVAETLNPLELTDRERGMFSAMLMMCPDREGLSNKVAIEKLNALFNHSMFEMMKRHHADYENKFARLVGIIPVFHMINQKHAMALNSMKMQKDEVVNEFPALQKEIFDVTTTEGEEK